MKLNTTLETNIVNWVYAITGLEVISEQEKYANPKPSGDFASYNILAPIKIGSDELAQKIKGQDEEDTYVVSALRYVPINIIIYAEDALYKATLLQLSLSQPTIWESYFSKNGFGFLKDDGLKDITEKTETGFEKRCLMSIIITVPFEVEDETGYIDSLKDLNMVINSEDGTGRDVVDETEDIDL